MRTSVNNHCSSWKWPWISKYLWQNIYFLVIDDENPTEVTAGAIVTVTVTLIRQDMKSLFGDESVPDAAPIVEGKTDEKGDAETENGK